MSKWQHRQWGTWKLSVQHCPSFPDCFTVCFLSRWSPDAGVEAAEELGAFSHQAIAACSLFPVLLRCPNMPPLALDRGSPAARAPEGFLRSAALGRGWKGRGGLLLGRLLPLLRQTTGSHPILCPTPRNQSRAVHPLH